MLSINSKLISEAIFHFFAKNYRNVISTTLPAVVEMTACGGNDICGYKVQLIWIARVNLCNTFYIIIYYNTFYIYIYIMILFLMFQSRNSHVPALGRSFPLNQYIASWHTSNRSAVHCGLEQGTHCQWCAVKYDGEIYPGIIQDTDVYSGALVKTMSRVGLNRFLFFLASKGWHNLVPNQEYHRPYPWTCTSDQTSQGNDCVCLERNLWKHLIRFGLESHHIHTHANALSLTHMQTYIHALTHSRCSKFSTSLFKLYSFRCSLQLLFTEDECSFKRLMRTFQYQTRPTLYCVPNTCVLT